MPEVLLISKPIVPPFDDSAKNVVVSQVRYGTRFQYRVLTAAGAPAPAPNVKTAPIYGNAGTYAPGLAQNLKVMTYGLRSRGAEIYHYFFAPNPVSSTAGRVQRLFARVKSVQTVCSQPKSFDKIHKLLFADRVIVLSEITKQKMVEAGIAAERLIHIRPGIDFIERKSDAERMAIRKAHGVPEKGPMILFPGDYEFSSAADTTAKAVPLWAASHSDATIVFACRIKRAPSLAIRDRIKAEVAAAGHQNRVVFLERVDDMPAFTGAADVVVMPAESLYAKMDVPLVLLEAASQGVPLVVANVPPLSELIPTGMAVGVSPGDPAALAEAVRRILDNSQEARAMGDAGIAAVRDIYSAQQAATAVERVYEEVLST